MGKVIIRKPAKIINSQVNPVNRINTFSNLPDVDLNDFKIGIFIHFFYTDTFEFFKEYLKNSKLNFTLYVNLVKNYSDKKFFIDEILKSFPSAQIIISDNIGKDIGGKLNLLSHWNKTNEHFDYLVFCHDKKSPHMKNDGGLKWRKELVDGVLSDNAIKLSLKLLQHNKIGMTGSNKWVFNGDVNDKNIYSDIKNKKYLENLLRMFNISNLQKISFVGGTMFWVKSKIFRNFFTNDRISMILELLEKGDVSEPSYTHAVERLFGCLIVYNNNIIGKTL